MVLKMASPWKDPKTGIFYLRVRVPTDLMAMVRGRTVNLPVGEETVQTKAGEAVKASLRTRDPREAKIRFATALTALNHYWEAIRQGPQKLSHKDAVALAGEVYHALVRAFEEDPGTYKRWANVAEMNDQARAGDYGPSSLMIGHQARARRAMEDRFGAITDAIVRAKGLVIDTESRERVLNEVSKGPDQATSQIKKFADGDYSPDPRASRFPTFQKHSEKPSSALTMAAMFQAWEKEALHDDATQVTVAADEKLTRLPIQI